MLIKNSLLLLIGLSFSQVSFAAEIQPVHMLKTFSKVSSGQDLPRPLPKDDAPIPLPPNSQDSPKPVGAFNFSDGKQLFDLGLLPTEQGLVGSWSVIGWADLSKSFANMTDFYHSNGKTNTDGSKWGVVFGWQVKEITNEKYFFSQFLNWGGKNSSQGPYMVRVDSSRKAAITSTFAYSGGSLSKTYFTYDCRAVHNNSDLVICGVTLKLNSVNAPAEQKAFDNVMGGMMVLKKSN